MNSRFLCASINETVVGTLQEVAGLWSFQYAADWLHSPQRFTRMRTTPIP